MYLKRALEDALINSIQVPQITLILGARQTGKTTLLKRLRELYQKDYSCFFINLENPEYKQLLNQHPQNLYKIIGPRPKKGEKKQIVFIDEIQYLEDPSQFLKFIYDEYQSQTKLVVSGSSSFYIDQKFRDSLTGRKKIFNLYGLNFTEFLRFKGEKEFEESLSASGTVPLMQHKDLEVLFLEYLNYGGYPEVVLTSDVEGKKDLLEAMSFDYIRKDLFEARIQNEEKYFHLLKILAHQCGQLVNVNELASTLNLSQPTVEHYLYTLQKSFHIALIQPFYRNIRKELSKMKKVYFYDLGLRNSLLRNYEPLDSRSDKGATLENLFFRELLFKHKLDHIKYWRTIGKNEVDFILNEKEAYEIKFNETTLKPYKYKLFQERFPEIDLSFITFNSLMASIFKDQQKT